MTQVETRTTKTVLIAASGSGGHLLPALYIANELKRINPGLNIHFVGSGRPLEAEVIGKAGFPVHTISIVGLKSRGFAGLLQFVCKLPAALMQTLRLFRNLKPNLVIGVGGYVTFLPVTVAWFKRIPRWIHEAERKPGLANKILSLYASAVSVAFAETILPRPKLKIFTGHPLRPELKQFRDSPKSVVVPKSLLVMGGSQGSQAIDMALIDLIPFIKRQGLSIWHQCREDNVAKVSAAYQAAGVSARVASFIHDMPEAYRFADLIVSRSGAGSVMELGVVNLPCILVPFPFAQGLHQHVNANILVSAGKALMVEEGAEFSKRLESAIEELLNPVRYSQMKKLPAVDRGLDAAEKIARGCLGLM